MQLVPKERKGKMGGGRAREGEGRKGTETPNVWRAGREGGEPAESTGIRIGRVPEVGERLGL